ncbi:MAG: NUDIX hydrolase [Haloechinothrix sp.]
MPDLPQDFRLPDGFVPPEVPQPPAEPRDAATVMLLRDGADGVEVFLQRRVAAMAFAPGMTVFPGGGVDTRDTDAEVRWAGPPAEEWAAWFGCAPGLARALVCAAVRETFEESGVLLAGPDPGTVVDDAVPYHQAREGLISRKLSLAEFLAGADLVLRADLLRAWSAWVTPEAEPRRYDTRFFLALLPAGQHADGATTEADTSGWMRPASALADAREGRSTLLPPTLVSVTELAEFGSAAEAFGAARPVPRFLPRVVRDGQGARVVFTPEDV